MSKIGRRTLIKAGLTTALTASTGLSAAFTATTAPAGVKKRPALRRKPIRAVDEVRAHLTGPIASIATPFNRDGSVDYQGLRNLIDFDIQAGSKTMLLTAGDSHYLCLSDDEIAEITRVTVEHTAGRAMVVSADRYHSTDRAVEFGKFAKDAGADVHMCMPPNWGPSCTESLLAEHYAAVAKHIPVMIVTNVFIKQGADFGLETVRLALAKSKNIVAIKDDMVGPFAQELGLLAHDRCALFAGGQKKNHLNMHPFGVDGYLSTFIQIKPKISHDYWAAIQANDMKTAWKITNDIDVPFFKHIMTLTGGWNAAIHAIHELTHIAKRYRRKPYYSFNDEEMDQLKDFLVKNSML